MTAAKPSPWEDARALFKLAWPIIIAYAGILTLPLVDVLMVGQYDSTHLAYFGVGLVPSNILSPLLVGLLMGVRVLVSDRYGAARFGETGAIMWKATGWAVFLGLGGLMVCAWGEQILTLSGQTAEVAERGGRISLIAGLSLPFLALNLAVSFFLEGIRRPHAGMVIMLVANLVNILANYMLVYGHWGAPELGAEGAAWATLAVRAVQSIAYIAYVWWMPNHDRLGVRTPPRLPRRTGRHLRRVGYAAGLSTGASNVAVNALALFAGLIGVAAVGAHVITITIFTLFYMFGLGIAMATAVRVGNAHGAGDAAGVGYWAWLGLAMQICVMVALAVFVFVFSGRQAGVFSGDSAVATLAAARLAYSTIALLFDAGQALFAASLRARGDTWTPTLIHAVSYLGVMIPVAWFASFQLGRGALGLVDAIIIGSAVPFVLLGLRHRRLDRLIQPAI